MSDRAPVAILGGGAYVARLVEVIAATDGLPPLELRLHARERGRLGIIAEHAAGRLLRASAPHAVRTCAAVDDALDGAAAVILLIRVGGLAARGHDESFPDRFGLVGDEGVGVGGLANGWRTLPVLDALAARISARAPAAHVLNLMAPLGVTTRLLVERGLRAVGLCELPGVTEARWRGRCGETPPLAYAGLNHLGFFWPVAGAAVEHPALRAAIAAEELPAALVERLGAAPLHYFVDVFTPEEAAALGRRRQPGRAAQLAVLQADLVRAFQRAPGAPVAAMAHRPTPWFDLALAPALAAVLGGEPYQAAIAVPNREILDEAPAGAVVEVAARLDATGVRVEPVPPRPAPVRALLARLARADDRLYEAALRRDRQALGDALDALPLPPVRARDALLDAICLPAISIDSIGEV